MLSAVMAEDNGAVAERFVVQHIGQNRIHAVVAPVQAVNIPLYPVVTTFFQGVNQGIVIVPVRWTEYGTIII